MKALVTGGEGGIGRALRARLEREGFDVESLDLTNGFDVTSPAAWERVGPVDVACLNAGVLTGELSYENYRRAVDVNVDGIVLGVLHLRTVMDAGAIVATASLAGLTGMPSDPVYSLTKHAVVGFVRSMAPQLTPIRLNAVCPGIADTPMIDGQRAELAAAAFPAACSRTTSPRRCGVRWPAAGRGSAGSCSRAESRRRSRSRICPARASRASASAGRRSSG